MSALTSPVAHPPRRRPHPRRRGSVQVGDELAVDALHPDRRQRHPRRVPAPAAERPGREHVRVRTVRSQRHPRHPRWRHPHRRERHHRSTAHDQPADWGQRLHRRCHHTRCRRYRTPRPDVVGRPHRRGRRTTRLPRQPPPTQPRPPHRHHRRPIGRPRGHRPSRGMISRCGLPTRLPDARSHAELAGAARPFRRGQGRRDPRAASRDRRAAPQQLPASVDLARPRRTQRAEQAAPVDCAGCGSCRREPCCAGTPSWSPTTGPTRADRQADHPLANAVRALVLRMARENPAGATDASRANWSASAMG